MCVVVAGALGMSGGASWTISQDDSCETTGVVIGWCVEWSGSTQGSQVSLWTPQGTRREGRPSCCCWILLLNTNYCNHSITQRNTTAVITLLLSRVQANRNEFCFYPATACNAYMQRTLLLSQFCLSVHPSDACIVTKLNDALRIFWYHTKWQWL